jgi:hypothetical protein
MYAVMIKPMNTICFVTKQPEALDPPIEENVEVVENVEIDIPPDLYNWPEGTDRPENALGEARDDPKRFKLFKYQKEMDHTEYHPTGINFGGLYSKERWDEFSKSLPALLQFFAMPDDPVPSAGPDDFPSGR